MKSRYMPILYVGMVFAAFAAGFYSLDRITRSLPRNPKKERSASTLPAKISEATPSEATLSEATLSDIRKSLEKQEYHISYDEQEKKLQSPNRSNNIRAYYEPGKLTVQTRVDTTGDGFKVELVNEGVFADGKLLYTPEANARADHHDNKVQIRHDAFTEEFINNEDGVRQNFIVKNAPDGTRQLQVKMTANGLKVTQGSGNELRFFSETPDGQTRNELVYSDLKCWDANKQPLNATLAYVDNHIQISVEVTGASYPVTIDPIIANGTPLNANKILEIHQSYMWLGFSVSSAGDVNGDGYSDVIVGAPKYDLGQDNEGAAFVYKGHASGLTLTAVTLECNQKDANMGYSVSSAGDFNGDGLSDVLVGIPYYDAGAGGLIKDAGMARLYFGSAQDIIANSAPQEFLTSNPGGNYGIAVATAGDIDADGFSDVLIGAHQLDYFGQTNSGLVSVIYGASTNYKKIEDLTANQANAMFGYSVAPAGDIDADGFSDVIVGARYYTNGQGQDAEGAAFIYRGSAGGLLTANPVIIEGGQYDAGMGNKVSSAGDVNGDGYSDILISAYVYDGTYNGQLVKDDGRVYLHLGSSTGIDPQPARIFTGGHIDDRMGSSIACAGDVNGDGYSDILIGAQHYDNGQFNEGAVFLYQGSKDGIVGSYASLFESNQADGWFGTAVSSAGDVNGDGYSDILIGCYTYDNGQIDEGHVFAYYGGAEGVGIKDATPLTVNKSSSYMGTSIASAGDVNSDGYDDIIAGAPHYDLNGGNEGIAILYYGSLAGINVNNKLVLESIVANGYFGGSVAGAGDVNGDGYDDVIVGAKEYTIGASHQGAVILYNGASGGLNPLGFAITVNKADADFGFCVAGGGDINRDGYADFLVGAPTFSAEGTIFVYYGASNGPANPIPINGTQSSSYFGQAVSSAGDVNGDGYNDIIAGALDATLGEQGEGAAYVFHGSNSGINTVAAKVIEGNQHFAKFGASVSSAGDVNGDGYSDVIVGGPDMDHGQEYEGVAIVYYGTIDGISTTAPVAPTLLEANQINAIFGSSVSGAGDVNGDGYSDVIVGAKHFDTGQDDEGKVFIFHGSPTGVKTTSSFVIEGEQVNANLGHSVSVAGDVNADGYSDILIGAPYYNNGQIADAGAINVYYGNNGKGTRNNVRLYNSDLTTPISYNQFSQPNFAAGLFTRSFIGKNKGKLVWETKGPGIPFSKVGNNPITTSNQFTNASPNFSNMIGTTVLKETLVKNGISTKVRVRVKYSPVLAITGQIYGPWRYVQSQLAGYNNAPVPEKAMAETQRKTTGVDSQDSRLSVVTYPNPVSDKLFVRSENAGQIRSIRFFTPGGKLIYESQNAIAEVDVRNLDPGIYVLLVDRQDGSQSSHKIIVKK